MFERDICFLLLTAEIHTNGHRCLSQCTDKNFTIERSMYSSAVFRCRKGLQLLFPTLLLTSEDEYKWYWHQMIYFPETYNKYNKYNITDAFTPIFLAMHINFLCACWHLKAMKGSSSLSSCRLLILSRLLSSLVRAQLTLLVPALGIRSPLPQNGAPIHRVRAHSLTGIRNNYHVEYMSDRNLNFCNEIPNLWIICT